MSSQLAGTKRTHDREDHPDTSKKRLLTEPSQSYSHGLHFDKGIHSTQITARLTDPSTMHVNDYIFSTLVNPNLPLELRPFGDGLCAAESPPCTDPNCDDFITCPADQTDWCQFSSECLGDICYDEGCLPDFQGHDLCCTEPCPDRSRCVSLGHDQICTQDSFAGPAHATTTACTSTHLQTPFERHHQHQPPRIIENSHFGEPCDCIDPHCLRRDDHTLPDRNHQAYHSASYLQPAPFSGYSHNTHVSHGNHHNYDHFASSVDASVTYQAPSDRDQFQSRCQPQSQSQFQTTSSWLPTLGGLNLPFRPDDCPTPDLTTSLKSTPTVSSEASILKCHWQRTSDGVERLCGLCFDSTEALHRHLEKAHVDGLQREDKDNNGFYCHWEGCDRYLCKSFQARPKLKRHMQTHTLYKPYTCDVCGVQMKTKDAMEKHARTHTGDRPYECKVLGCKKVFATSTELKTHMVVHSGEKPHQCPICKECFADSSNLSKHKKTHFVGMYKCPVCDARMKRWDQMRRHIVTQNHASHLLVDRNAQQEYKTRMEKEFNELSHEERGIGKVASVLMDMNLSPVGSA